VSIVCYQVEVSATGPIARPEDSYRVRCVWVWSTNLIEEA